MRVGVFGASGYTGLELLRLLLQHPEFEIVAVTSEQRAGQPVGEAFPALRGRLDLAFEPARPEHIAERLDLAFTALPHAASAPTVAALRRAGVRVADLSADFRLRDLPLYEQWYGTHAAPELVGKAVYGLPELYRDALAGADLAAVPGCYPTSALLPLVPFLREGLVETSGIVVDAKSGVSGAGRSLDARYLFAELDANAHAYKVGAHRHGPEMEQEASLAAGEAVRLTFVPQLIPTTRGILASVYCRPTRALSAEAAQTVLEAAWGAERFVRVLPQGEMPSLQSVRGSNFCDVGVVLDERNGTLVLLAAIDNLVKGASGQALQCANLMAGHPEETGLLGGAQLP
ncbi:MAG: N-acetyl-gamma-glutamyl-phosphate reductase [Deltaproteobacteria bacterium]|nr:N-acetyl-gamma-glutamyl-phosphate reductase [Deltaproteobacteria bacterium]MBW2362437.1 N-acetyl-gamma-glutamyl-phosphate reductase [Deltaproteobacteria bacterium]